MGVQYWNGLSVEEVKLKVTHVRRKNILTAFGGGWASSGSHNLKCQQGATQYSFLKKSNGRRSLVGCSPWGHEESDMTEQLHFHLGNKHKLLKHGEGKNKERKSNENDEAMENQRTPDAQLWKMVDYENADLEELGLQKFQKKLRI